MNSVNRRLVNMYELVSSVTNACDLVSPELGNHHQQVAYLSYQIGTQIGLAQEQLKNLMLAGLLHDVGALSYNERHELVESEPPHAHDHAFRGAALLEKFPPLAEAAGIIRFHHIPWNDGEGNRFLGIKVPLLSHLVHLADRTVVLIDKNKDVLRQVRGIIETIDSQRKTKFVPELVDALLAVSSKESIWLDLVNSSLCEIIRETMIFDTMDLNFDDTIKLTKIFASIIDFRSPFTAYHSAGVAKTAEKLAELAGFSEEECKMMLVAGYLHDLGKLAVKNEVLEKPGKLDAEEYNIIRSHSYYTYRLLQPIKAFEQLNVWAALHHERLDGTGYPFQLSGDSLSLGARILTVADVFTAITENRPYRKGLDHKTALQILQQQVADHALCPYVVSILAENIAEVNRVREEAQLEAGKEYNYYIGYSDIAAGKIPRDLVWS
ncbi:MAG: HD domain-containing protein [Firmicutes bacterium]|nr:HD domain-containing protein [Bacillota bacterium]